MSKLVWDDVGDRVYETGVNKAVLYHLGSDSEKYDEGYAWNGIVNITESPSGAEPNPVYADNIKYLNLLSAEDLGLSIEAYTYPDEFAECDGSAEVSTGIYVGQQRRKTFGLCYRSLIGNDADDTDHGYKLHLVYGCLAAPTTKEYSTVNDSPEAITFSWDVTTTPVPVTGFKPTALITINSTKVDKTKLAELEELLYGGDDAEAELPLPDEIIELFGAIGSEDPIEPPTGEG